MKNQFLGFHRYSTYYIFSESPFLPLSGDMVGSTLGPSLPEPWAIKGIDLENSPFLWFFRKLRLDRPKGGNHPSPDQTGDGACCGSVRIEKAVAFFEMTTDLTQAGSRPHGGAAATDVAILEAAGRRPLLFLFGCGIAWLLFGAALVDRRLPALPRDAISGSIRDLVTPVNSQGPWKFLDPQLAQQPAIPCLPAIRCIDMEIRWFTRQVRRTTPARARKYSGRL